MARQITVGYKKEVHTMEDREKNNMKRMSNKKNTYANRYMPGADGGDVEFYATSLH